MKECVKLGPNACGTGVAICLPRAQVGLGSDMGCQKRCQQEQSLLYEYRTYVTGSATAQNPDPLL